MGNRVITGGMSTIQTHTSCKNCGHPSHCGSSAYMTMKDYACDGGEYREVKICGSCNCKQCKDKVLNKKGSN